MKRMENVKIIIWDCDNTIWFHRKDEAKIVAKEIGIPFTEEFNKQYYNMFTAFGKYFTDRKVAYGKTLKVIRQSMPILNKHGVTVEEFIKKWFKLETSFLNEDVLDTIKCLRERGYKNIVLTDWLWECQVPLLKKYGILPYIDTVYTCDNHYLKKNIKSAARVIESGHEEEYVIIGDSLNDDIAFANHAGIKSIWYNPECKKNETTFKPTSEICSILEVCKIMP